MTGYRRGPLAALLLCALATPALADSATYSLTGTWQKIASAGQGVDVQNNAAAGFAVLSTATGGAPSAMIGQALGPGEHRLYSLAADLYAFGIVPVVVTTGLATTGSLPAGAATFAGQTQIDADLKAVQPRSILATPIVITSTEVAVPAAASTQLLAANAARRFLSATNDGVNPCRVSYGAAATATNGEPLAGAAAPNGQGGGRSFDASAITQQAVFAYCAAPSSFAVLEGQ